MSSKPIWLGFQQLLGALIRKCWPAAVMTKVYDYGMPRRYASFGPNTGYYVPSSHAKTMIIQGESHPVQFLGHSNYIYSIAFSPKGNMLVSGSYDEAVFLWDVRGARVMRSLPAHSDPVGGVDFVRDGTLIASCGGDGLIRVWDTATGQCLRTLVHEDTAPVVSVRFSPNGRFVLAWTLDSCVRLWHYVEGRCLKTYQGHVNTKYSLAGAFGVYGDEDEQLQREGGGRAGYAPARQALVASGSEDGAIVLWDVASKEVLQRLEGHESVVLGVDARKGMLASGGLDGTVRIWAVKRSEVDEGAHAFEGDEADHMVVGHGEYRTPNEKAFQ